MLGNDNEGGVVKDTMINGLASLYTLQQTMFT